jgi:hypothetical protein
MMLGHAPPITVTLVESDAAPIVLVDGDGRTGVLVELMEALLQKKSIAS